MTTRDWRVWVLGGTLGLTLVLSAVNIWLHQRNLTLQVEVTERQQRINEGVRLSQFNTQFVQALATMAAGTDDAAIRDLLANHGITYTVNAPATEPGAPAGGSR